MLTLEAKNRTTTGKAVKSLRNEGWLPAVIYGAKVSSQAISVPAKEFRKVFQEAGESTLVSVSIEGKPHTVLIHDVLLDPVTDRPLHADFLAVQMDKEIHAKTPLEFIGESAAVKAKGGILVKVMHELEISALPKDLPHSIKIDISKLVAIGDRLTLADIEIPHGVKPLVPEDEVVVLIEAPRSEEELAALETAAAAETVEVMTEAEAKKKAEEEAKAAAGEGEEAK